MPAIRVKKNMQRQPGRAGIPWRAFPRTFFQKMIGSRLLVSWVLLQKVFSLTYILTIFCTFVIIWLSIALQRILLASPTIRSTSENCIMKQEQDETQATIASAVERTSTSALKRVVETALKDMWRRLDIKYITAVTRLKSFIVT
jgi:hypothetical protein